MKMFLAYTAALLITAIIPVNAQTAFQSPVWTDIDKNDSHIQAKTSQLSSTKNLKAKYYRSINVDFYALTQQMSNQKLIIEVPIPDGEIVKFELSENSVLPTELSKKYPSIRAFNGVQVDNPNHTGRFDITPQGFHGLITYKGKTIYIDPQYQGNPFEYASYYKQDAQKLASIPADLVKAVKNNTNVLAAKSVANSPINKTYRIAFSATGEYSEFHGGTKELVLAALTTLTNRMNQVFERDLAVSLQLVAETDAVIFLDPVTDPFLNNDDDVYKNAVVLQQYLGNDKFDLGHVVTTGAGGLAGVGVACDNDLVDENDPNSGVWKALGVTGSLAPTNDSFYIDFVAHELGHQFGAEHSFNSLSEACSGNRWETSAFEPGSGSTIMAYTGICAPTNLQENSDDYFHVESIREITTYLTNDPWGIGQTCGQTLTNNNNAPTVDAGNNYTIPANTPFKLTAQANDIDGDDVTYTWEQVDLGTASFDPETMVDDGSRPIFRSYKPSLINYRVLPQLESILSGELVMGENYPTTNRALNFKVTARDGVGGVASDSMIVNVEASSDAFIITQPSVGEFWQNETQSQIRWNVSNTNSAPINCMFVDIEFSANGGESFNTMLATNTANDGEHIVSTPSGDSKSARLKVSCVDNIFFNISDEFEVFNPPVANDDAYDVAFESKNNIFDVLVNDSDLTPGDNLSLISVTYNGEGAVSIINNTLSYTAPNNYTGSETLTYQIADKSGYRARATVTITVNEKTTSKSSSGALLWLNLMLLLFLIKRSN
ncbi:M12 family metallo-peptidase [Thalassotalea psychrophila]|uniref:M12 family metallo-peptidase n=1 Tax=Thalassotalea psychrophila TaxID=3065647 RepID=A0ABY9TZA5_9GAMM|nr:M12 family metallo-peptidase [Colwelliaceae bacterium SQ149]